MEEGAPCATPVTDVEVLSRTLGSVTLVRKVIREKCSYLSKDLFKATRGSKENSNDSGDETIPDGTSSRDKLNEFLSSRDISPIRSKLNKRWHCTNERTKRHYTRKARQAVHAIIEEIAPGDTDCLWEALVSSRGMVRQLPMDPELHADSTLIMALTECYNNAGHWSTRRQILSILADKVSFKMLKRWIPGLTHYRFNIARHHQLLHGRGAVLPTEHHTRMYVAPGQLSHFLNFITSGHIIQDLPFGESSSCRLTRNWLCHKNCHSHADSFAIRRTVQ